MGKHFADFWDQIASRKGARQRSQKVQKYIKKHRPGSKKVLELGVGNGLVLSLLPKRYEKWGLDIEKRFVALAQQKMPEAKLKIASMHDFSFHEKFDVVFSIWDSINFLENFTQWKQTFTKTAEHLEEKGLFIFDMYTPKMLEVAKTWTFFFDEPFGHMMDRAIVKGNKLSWDFMIFQKKGKLYEKHQFFFHEKIYELEKVEKELKRKFVILEKIDGDSLKKPTKDTTRVMYIAQKK